MSQQSRNLITPKTIECVRKTRVSPHLLRVTFIGDDLNDFPEKCGAGHLKIFLPNQESGILQLPQRDRETDTVIWPEHKPVARAYTVRKFRKDEGELDIDFVDHGLASPGSGWAVNAKPGDKLGLIGPGGPDPMLEPADWHILACDLTGLPAVSAILEELSDDARGEVFIEVESLAEVHELEHPPGVNIHWIEIDFTRPEYCLANGISTITVPDNTASVSGFIAGENSSVKECRRYLVKQFGLTKQNLYAIPYWRRGKNEEAYHHERHTIMDQNY